MLWNLKDITLGNKYIWDTQDIKACNLLAKSGPICAHSDCLVPIDPIRTHFDWGDQLENPQFYCGEISLPKLLLNLWREKNL